MPVFWLGWLTGWEKGVGVRSADAKRVSRGCYETTKFLWEIGLVKGVFVLILNTNSVKYEHAFRC